MTPNQYEKERLKWASAKMTHDAVSPLKDMNPEQASEHIATFSPDEKAGEEHYAQVAKVQAKAIAAWKKVEDERSKDPAHSVVDAPEVAKVRAMMQTLNIPDSVQMQDGQPAAVKSSSALPDSTAREALIKARLDAQTRVGVAPWRQRTITKGEAESLLQLPDPKEVSDTELMTALKKAGDRAVALYGRTYGPKVLKDALALGKRTKDERLEAETVVSGLVRGTTSLESLFGLPKDDRSWWSRITGGGNAPTWRDDMQGAQSLDKADKIGTSQEFDRNLRPDLGDTARPYISPMHGAEAMAYTQSYAAQEAAKQPNARHVKWLQDNPEGWATFDARFGRGAAAAALKKADQSQ